MGYVRLTEQFLMNISGIPSKVTFFLCFRSLIANKISSGVTCIVFSVLRGSFWWRHISAMCLVPLWFFEFTGPISQQQIKISRIRVLIRDQHILGGTLRREFISLQNAHFDLWNFVETSYRVFYPYKNLLNT